MGDDGPMAIRQKLAARLTELAEQLPEDLHLATMAAFALITEARLPLYQDRVHWVATKVDRDSRTVRRWVDDAIDQLAELAAIIARSRTSCWHTAELRVAVVLDRQQPEILVQHRVIANQDGVYELRFAPPLLEGQRDLDVDVLYGGTLLDRGAAVNDHPGCALVPAEPLSQGESHVFAVRFRLPNTHTMQPYLVYAPEHPCELFDLRVRFGNHRKPPHVWTLRGAHQRAGSVPAHHGSPYPVDRAGEIHLRFRRLVPGLGYGARWGRTLEPTIPAGTWSHDSAHRSNACQARKL
ncbi:hypothetical protein [Streptoalloteichus hindustanus]|uniref:hypothetical protein n=1 Tax=Streptoalloteichus hindustanus TaxID=2017 RepID=UPI0011610100|nr:hypothetical protein [Streptoalloteichus hindustanus]